MATTICYSVRTVQREDVRFHDGSMAMEKGTKIYLDWTTEGGGWVQWRQALPGVTPWETVSDALEAAKHADGMPWWFKPDMDALKPVRITRTSSHHVEDV